MTSSRMAPVSSTCCKPLYVLDVPLHIAIADTGKAKRLMVRKFLNSAMVLSLGFEIPNQKEYQLPLWNTEKDSEPSKTPFRMLPSEKLKCANSISITCSEKPG